MSRDRAECRGEPLAELVLDAHGRVRIANTEQAAAPTTADLPGAAVRAGVATLVAFALGRCVAGGTLGPRRSVGPDTLHGAVKG